MNNKKLNKVALVAISLAAVLFCVYISWMPVFHHNSWSGHDYLFHINRMLSSVNSIKNGQPIPFYDIDYINHPGYGSNLFYPPLTNMLGSLAFYISQDLNLSVKFLAVFIAILSTGTAYISLVRINNNKSLSIIYSLCFSCSIYMIDNIFIRSSYPEAIAICAIPLFFYGLNSKVNKESFVFLVLANVIFILSNIPATLCSGVIFLIYYVLNRKKLSLYIASVCTSILLCAWYVGPLLYSTYGESFTMLDRNWFPVMSQKAITAYELISGEMIKTGPLTGMALGIGLPTIIALAWTYAKTSDKNPLDYIFILIISFIICGGINFDFLGGALVHFSKIQFTWRFVPFLLFIILTILHASQKISAKYALLIFISTSLMTSAITVPKNSSRNLTIELAASANFKDYVLSNAPEIGKLGKVIKCENGKSYPYSRSLGTNGLPVFTLNIPTATSCTIPFMAYKSLNLTGAKDFTREGYFKATLTSGKKILKVEISQNFKRVLLFSYIFSIVSIIFVFFVIARLNIRSFITAGKQ
ncbi:hypothetical protein [Pseudocitrobacter faecalis]|uniref:Membrane protein YfhO n=1 Tax=Pseudocitrobacter faecalis TaxID=1398493 RepID=A0ABX9G3G1_9ENTR|nr:hypothetical protein DFQ50_101539 [Pseudocitrobacter faecalis]